MLPTTASEEHFSKATHTRGVYLHVLCLAEGNEHRPLLGIAQRLQSRTQCIFIYGSTGGMSAFAKPIRLHAASTHNLLPRADSSFDAPVASVAHRRQLRYVPAPSSSVGKPLVGMGSPAGVNRKRVSSVLAHQRSSIYGEEVSAPRSSPSALSRHRNRRNTGKRPFRPFRARMCSHGARAFRASVAAGAPRLHHLCGSCAYAARVADTQRDIYRRPGRRATSSAVWSLSMQRVDVHLGRRMAWHA